MPKRRSSKKPAPAADAPRPAIVTVKHVADLAGQPLELTRDVLNEAAGVKASRAVQDRIFNAARRLGYDLRKLKIGKRMQARKDTLTEVLKACEAHPEWSRADILAYLDRTLQLLDRVRRKVFEQEFDDPWL